MLVYSCLPFTIWLMSTDGLDKTVAIRLEESLAKELEDFRFEHRFFNRSETVRWLLQWALRQKPKPPKTQSERFPKAPKVK